MQCLPSAVHLPQHSSGGSCQPASKPPRSTLFADSSQTRCWTRLPGVSEVSNRKWLLSSDHVTFLISPVILTTLRDSVPSAFARNKSFRFAYARIFPSGDRGAV